MAKFSKKLQSDEFELLQYRLDVLERRLDNMEKLVHSKNDGGLNAELMQFVMTLLKQQMQPTVVPSQTHAIVQPQNVDNLQSTNAVEQQKSAHDPPSTLVESFMRRRTFV